MAEKDKPKKDQPKAEQVEPNEPTEAADQDHGRDRFAFWGGQQYYSELMRIITTLFVGVLALMTFLLTVGLQRPKGTFEDALYAALILLPLNLLAFVFGHLFMVQVRETKLADGDQAKVAAARKRLKVVRFLQQLLFVLAVLSVAWLAVSAAQFFFNAPANPMGAGPSS